MPGPIDGLRRPQQPESGRRLALSRPRVVAGRYCIRCGTRLTLNALRADCDPCRHRATELLAGAPPVPAQFWTVDRIRDALAAWHMGQVIAAYRRHPYHGRPLSQELVGSWAGLAQAQISRIENGPPIKDLDRLTRWAYILHIPGPLLWFKLPEHGQPSVDLS